jgi:glycosyltransferase involved in cell wall biosynthesis
MKGHPVFLDAALRVAEACPAVHFLLAGTGVEPGAPFFARWLAAHPGMAPRVHLIGRRSDTARLMAALDVYVSPSLGEGFPNSVAEAMSSGVPVVASDAGDSRAIVGESGIVAPVGDTSGLAEGCLAILREPEEARRIRSERARTRVVERFELARAVAEYEDMIDGVLERRGRPR